MRKMKFLTTIAGITLAVACHGTPPADVPVPQPTLVELRHPILPQGSLAGVTPSAADSVERARQLGLDGRARGVADRQLRLAEQTRVERAAFVAAERSAELQEELRVMVHFDLGSAKLQPAGQTALDRKVAILLDNPTVRLQIAGASDERGSARQNLALGNRRANAVKQYLVGRGIDPARLKEVSSGEQAPLDSGRTEAAWARNRRVEFVIARGDVLLELR